MDVTAAGATSGPDRFRDPSVTLHAFGSRALVRCPNCGECAQVLPRPGTVPDTPGHAHSWRLTCTSCPHSADLRITCSGWGGPVDPYFGLPLWLQADCCGGKTLWAYNGEHLGVLERMVAATLRERPEEPPPGAYRRRMTMIAKLPAWLKDRKNRDEILRVAARLRGTIPSSLDR